ncbi:MAG: heavy-metal-associated domain-containing protein [Thermodesulfobacteriota bacterium]
MATIRIKGMSCQHCVMAVTKALGGVEGIADVRVDLEKGEAAFTEVSPVDRKAVAQAVKKAGFDLVD